jgi:hypothetical protein
MELKAQITEFLEKSKEMSKTEAESGEIGPMVNDIPLLVIERAHGRVLYPLVYIVPKRLRTNQFIYNKCHDHGTRFKTFHSDRLL